MERSLPDPASQPPPYLLPYRTSLPPHQNKPQHISPNTFLPPERTPLSGSSLSSSSITPRHKVDLCLLVSPILRRMAPKVAWRGFEGLWIGLYSVGEGGGRGLKGYERGRVGRRRDRSRRELGARKERDLASCRRRQWLLGVLMGNNDRCRQWTRLTFPKLGYLQNTRVLEFE